MAKFRLNEKLIPSNYKNIEDISNIKNWKAKILVGNSMSDDKKVGDWEEVGYVWISLVDNSIVPLARSDEHHQGYDALVELGINANDYYPVFLGGDYNDGRNNQYPYDDKDAKELKVALLKLQYYGRDLNNINVNMHYILNDYNVKPISGTKFIEGKYGSEEFENNELTELGEELVKNFEKLSKVYQDVAAYRKKSSALLPVINNLFKLCKNIKLDSGDKLFSTPVLDNVLDYIKFFDENGNEKFLETALFGFGGLRNTIHQALRKRINEKNLNSQLGNVSKVIELLAAI